MGLDVGVVKVAHLERPVGVIYDFLWTLAEQFDEAVWGGGWEGNAFIEITELNMLTRAIIYAAEHNLSQQDSDDVVAWIRQLPWNGDTIMLHLNY